MAASDTRRACTSTASASPASTLHELCHFRKALLRSWSLTSLTILALPMPTGKGNFWPMEFFTRLATASAKRSYVMTGLQSGTWHLRSMFSVRSSCAAEMRPRCSDSTAMNAMSQATDSPCISSRSVPKAAISRSWPMQWPKSTRRSKECSQRLGASSSSMVSMESCSTRPGARSLAPRGANFSVERRGPCASRSSKSSSDFMMAILAISAMPFETSRHSCVSKKQLSRRAAQGGT
mmetsp:Transcript_28574/g.72262  ORF Transcript_28574/g.72262 Transcript_28574/m.72262 type:complete len:236 (-) Transcript_28574:92-799(-)